MKSTPALPSQPSTTLLQRVPWLSGVAVAATAGLFSWAIHLAFPAIPLLTAAVALGILVAQIPAAGGLLGGALRVGLSLVSKRFMRLGIVLLGLKLGLVDIMRLGWVSILGVVAVVLLTFGITLWMGRLFKLPGHQPLLVATGFAICGASAIGAVSGAVKAKNKDTATPVALVTLCGTLAIAVLPALWHPLGLNAEEFGHWVGAGVHDVGQVVATAQIAGTTALALAVIVKLTRVLMLVPIVSIVAIVAHRRTGADSVGSATNTGTTKRPPILPLFVVGFLSMVLLRTLVDVPANVLEATDLLQTALLAMALFGLGTAVRLRELVRTGWRALIVGVLSWGVIAVLALGAVVVS